MKDFDSVEAKKAAFIKEFKALFARYNAEITIEDFGRSYMRDEQIVVNFDYDKLIDSKTGNGSIPQWVVGSWEDGR